VPLEHGGRLANGAIVDLLEPLGVHTDLLYSRVHRGFRVAQLRNFGASFLPVDAGLLLGRVVNEVVIEAAQECFSATWRSACAPDLFGCIKVVYTGFSCSIHLDDEQLVRH